MAYFLGFFRRITIWGIIGLLVCLIAFGVPFSSVIEAAKAPTASFQNFYYAYTFYCLFAFLLFEIASIIYWKIHGDGISMAFESLGTDLGYPFYNIYVFLVCILKRDFNPTAMAEFIVAIILIGFNVLGVLNAAGVTNL